MGNPANALDVQMKRGGQGAADLKAVLYRSQIKIIDGTSYALMASDAGLTLKTTSASAVSITVPAGLNLSAPVFIWQYGAGQVTLVEGSGVHIRTAETLLLAKQYAKAEIATTDVADEYSLSGYLRAAA
jgi:hypothetical protein